MKRLAIGIGILIVLLVGAFAAVIVTLNSVDWSEYQEPIAKAVKDATGREVHFSGALNVNISLSPGVSADDVTFQNASWASRDEMLVLEHVEIHLKLLPLIFGQIEVSRLEIAGFDLQLETNQQGKGNWEFVPAETDMADDIDPEQDPVSDDEALLTAAVLKKAVITNAVIVYNDGVTGESQHVTLEELTAQMDAVNAPLRIELKASYGEEPVELEGTFAGLGGLPGGEPLGLDMTINALGATVAIMGDIDKPLEADGIAVTVNASGDSLSRLAEFADAPIADPGKYSITATIAGNAEQIDVTNLSIGMADMQLDGDLQMDIATQPMRLDAALHSPRIDLTRLLPPEESVESPPNDVSSGQPGDQSERLFPDDPLPLDGLDALESINAVVDFKVGELIVDPETTITDLDIRLQAAPKTISIDPLNLVVMDATINGSVGLEAVQDAAAVTALLDISILEIGDLVEASGNTTLAGGPANLNIDVAGNGASVRAIMASLNGFLAVELGASRAGSPLLQRAFADIEAILTKTAPQYGKSEPIELHCVVTDFRITDGIAVTDSFVVDAHNIALFGAGRIDLHEETLHLNFDWLAARVKTQNVLPPFKIRGTLAAPAGRFDTKALLGNALGIGAGPMNEIDFKPASLTAESGPERCRQRLVAYEQIRERRAQPKEVTVESVLKDIETTKDALKNLGGFFKQKKKDR